MVGVREGGILMEQLSLGDVERECVWDGSYGEG